MFSFNPTSSGSSIDPELLRKKEIARLTWIRKQIRKDQLRAQKEAGEKEIAERRSLLSRLSIDRAACEATSAEDRHHIAVDWTSSLPCMKVSPAADPAAPIAESMAELLAANPAAFRECVLCPAPLPRLAIHCAAQMTLCRAG
jgi:hypothetical protein